MIFTEYITEEGRMDYYINSKDVEAIPEITHWNDDKMVEIGNGIMIPETTFVTIANDIKRTMECR